MAMDGSALMERLCMLHMFLLFRCHRGSACSGQLVAGGDGVSSLDLR